MQTLYNSIMNRRLLCLVLIFCAVVSGCGGGKRKPESIATTSATPREPDKSLPKILAFGDSLTAGYGLPISASYPSLLQTKLNAAGYQYEVVNAGISGDTSAGGARRIDWALQGDVRVVILELGANDILRALPVAETKKNLAEIIERAKSRGARVLLAGMEAPTDAGTEYRRSVHDAFLALSQEHKVALIPFFLSGVAGIESLNQRDGIHPNEQGTEMVAETVYQALLPLLSTDPAKPDKKQP